MKVQARGSWYDRYVLPYLIDIACNIKAVRRQRRKVVPLARGLVLEIGIGTGLNLEYYDKTTVERIVGLDPGLAMHHLAHKRVEQAGLTVELVGLFAERVPFAAGTFDTVVVRIRCARSRIPQQRSRRCGECSKAAANLSSASTGLRQIRPCVGGKTGSRRYGQDSRAGAT